MTRLLMTTFQAEYKDVESMSDPSNLAKIMK